MEKTVLFSAVCLCLMLAAMDCRAEVLVDQLDDTERSEGYVLTQSHISGDESTSSFMLGTCAAIQKITWSGSIKPNEDNLYPFAIRIYNTNRRRPAKMEIFEFVDYAEMKSPGDNNTFPHIFTYTFKEDFYLPAGERYWISILYAGPYVDNFYMAIEENRSGTRYGHGGALRRSETSRWFPTNLVFPFPYLMSRGWSIKIEAEPLSEEDCPVIAG